MCLRLLIHTNNNNNSFANARTNLDTWNFIFSSLCTFWMWKPWTFHVAAWIVCECSAVYENKMLLCFKSHCHFSSLLCCSHFKMQFTTHGGVQIKNIYSQSRSLFLSLCVYFTEISQLNWINIKILQRFLRAFQFCFLFCFVLFLTNTFSIFNSKSQNSSF